MGTGAAAFSKSLSSLSFYLAFSSGTLSKSFDSSAFFSKLSFALFSTSTLVYLGSPSTDLAFSRACFPTSFSAASLTFSLREVFAYSGSLFTLGIESALSAKSSMLIYSSTFLSDFLSLALMVKERALSNAFLILVFTFKTGPLVSSSSAGLDSCSSAGLTSSSSPDFDSCSSSSGCCS